MLEKSSIVLMLCTIALASVVTVIEFASEQKAFADPYFLQDKASCESLPGGSPEWIDATSTCQLNSDLEISGVPYFYVSDVTLAISDNSTLEFKLVSVFINSGATVEVAPGGAISCNPCSTQAFPLTNNGMLVNHGTITGRSVSEQPFGIDNTGTIINTGIFNVNTTNYLPYAPIQHIYGQEGTSGVNIKWNAYDADGDATDVFVTSLPQSGVLFGPADPALGDVTYQPNNRFFHGTDSFTFSAFDGLSEGPELTVFITILDEDEAVPAAFPQELIAPVGRSVPITLTGYDPGGAPLTFTVGSQPSHGTLNGTAPNLTYTPDPGFSGTDSFDFIVNNGAGDSAPANVTIQVSEGLTQPRKPIGNRASGTIINSGTFIIPTNLVNNGTINNNMGG